jgi:chemotaxis signal transduction protein
MVRETLDYIEPFATPDVRSVMLGLIDVRGRA